MLPRILKAKNEVKKREKGGESRGILGRGHSPCKSMEVKILACPGPADMAGKGQAVGWWEMGLHKLSGARRWRS